jgi:NDP-sugar pyrophosphorylase family protein
MRPSQAVIICGGLGTRLEPLTQDIPKSMVPVKSRPFLEYLVEHFKGQGVPRFIFCTGHLHDQIESHFGDGSAFGVNIQYSNEKEPLGTGGALLNARALLDDRFFLSYGDSLLPIQLAPMVDLFDSQPALGVITVYDNHEKLAPSNVHLDKDGTVLAYSKERCSSDMNGVEAGLSLFSKTILELAIQEKFSLEMDIFPKLINRGRLFGLLTLQRFYDIGTPEGLEQGKGMFDDLG